MTTTRKMAIILAADVQDFSRRMQEDDEATVRALKELRKIFSETVATEDGREFGSVGDSLMAEFVSIRGALRCARFIQSAVEMRNDSLSDNEQMQLRIGLDSGEVLTDEEGSVYGDTVNIAARLQALAPPGGICLSGSVQEQLRGRGDWDLALIGEQKLKNIEHPVTVYNLGKGNPPKGLRALSSYMKVGVVLAAVLVVAALSFVNSDNSPDETGNSASTSEQPADAIANSLTDNGMPSLAILRFKTIGASQSTAFAASMNQEILRQAANLQNLVVKGGTSSLSEKVAAMTDVRLIGETLGAGNLLEGSVILRGNNLRVTMLLNSANEDRVVWSKTYDRNLADESSFEDGAFGVQDELVRNIVADLQTHFNPGLDTDASASLAGSAEQTASPTDSREAYALYQSATIAANRFDFFSARENLQQAIEIDAEFAEAYELLAYCDWYLAGTADTSAALQELSYDAATKALELDENLVFAQALQVAARTSGYSLADEIEAFKQALETQPNNTWAYGPLIFRLMEVGYLNEALEVAERYAQLDPLSAVAKNRLFEARLAAGQLAEAQQALGRAEELDPSLPNKPGSANWALAYLRLADGNYPAAIQHFSDHFRSMGSADVEWVAELINAAQDPLTGASYLERRIPEIVAEHIPAEAAFEAESTLNTWYPFFGFMPRYFEFLNDIGLTGSAWTDADVPVWLTTMFRSLEFTADPAYPAIAESLGFVEIWEARGAPDFCQQTDGEWVCT